MTQEEHLDYSHNPNNPVYDQVNDDSSDSKNITNSNEGIGMQGENSVRSEIESNKSSDREHKVKYKVPDLTSEYRLEIGNTIAAPLTSNNIKEMTVITQQNSSDSLREIQTNIETNNKEILSENNVGKVVDISDRATANINFHSEKSISNDLQSVTSGKNPKNENSFENRDKSEVSSGENDLKQELQEDSGKRLKKSQENDDPIARLNALRANISNALKEVKAVLEKHAPSVDEPEKNDDIQPEEDGCIKFRFVRRVRKKSQIELEDQEVICNVGEKKEETQTAASEVSQEIKSVQPKEKEAQKDNEKKEEPNQQKKTEAKLVQQTETKSAKVPKVKSKDNLVNESPINKTSTPKSSPKTETNKAATPKSPQEKPKSDQVVKKRPKLQRAISFDHSIDGPEEKPVEIVRPKRRSLIEANEVDKTKAIQVKVKSQKTGKTVKPQADTNNNKLKNTTESNKSKLVTVTENVATKDLVPKETAKPTEKKLVTVTKKTAKDNKTNSLISESKSNDVTPVQSVVKIEKPKEIPQKVEPQTNNLNDKEQTVTAGQNTTKIEKQKSSESSLLAQVTSLLKKSKVEPEIQKKNNVPITIDQQIETPIQKVDIKPPSGSNAVPQAQVSKPPVELQISTSTVTPQGKSIEPKVIQNDAITKGKDDSKPLRLRTKRHSWTSDVKSKFDNLAEENTPKPKIQIQKSFSSSELPTEIALAVDPVIKKDLLSSSKQLPNNFISQIQQKPPQTPIKTSSTNLVAEPKENQVETVKTKSVAVTRRSPTPPKKKTSPNVSRTASLESLATSAVVTENSINVSKEKEPSPAKSSIKKEPSPTPRDYSQTSAKPPANTPATVDTSKTSLEKPINTASGKEASTSPLPDVKLAIPSISAPIPEKIGQIAKQETSSIEKSVNSVSGKESSPSLKEPTSSGKLETEKPANFTSGNETSISAKETTLSATKPAMSPVSAPTPINTPSTISKIAALNDIEALKSSLEKPLESAPTSTVTTPAPIPSPVKNVEAKSQPKVQAEQTKPENTSSTELKNKTKEEQTAVAPSTTENDEAPPKPETLKPTPAEKEVTDESDKKTEEDANNQNKTPKKRKMTKKVIIKRIKRRLSRDDSLDGKQEPEICERELEDVVAKHQAAERAEAERLAAEQAEAEKEAKEEEEKLLIKSKLTSCLKQRSYNPGEKVLYADHVRKAIKWKHGVVLEKISNNSYKLEIEGVERPAHVSYIKRYTDKKVQFGGMEFLEIDYEQENEESEEEEPAYNIWARC